MFVSQYDTAKCELTYLQRSFSQKYNFSVCWNSATIMYNYSMYKIMY